MNCTFAVLKQKCPENMRTNLTRYTVTAPDVTGISLDVESALIYEGKTLQLSAFITPEDANQDVIWSSSDEGIATVDQNGLVTALKEGTATITVSAEGSITAACDVILKNKLTFTDVADPSVWFYNSVYWAVENGVTSGMGEGTFQPMAKLSRAQTVTFLYNLAGRPDVSGPQAKEFTDVSNTAWYYNAVKWAVANKITSGYGTGTFQPNATCNRAMMVTFLKKVAELPKV
ncbi:MAG: S-layer homology domain-containing protein [Succiniclasticum sp.]|nr:S-layer homology domain-containing protein [Succiniclasticum sp.]